MKTYEEALSLNYIGVRDYLRRANIGLSKEMLKKLIAVFKLQPRVIKSPQEVIRVYSKARLDYILKEFYPTITNRTKFWHNSTIVSGDFMCNKRLYKKYIDSLKDNKDEEND